MPDLAKLLSIPGKALDTVAVLLGSTPHRRAYRMFLWSKTGGPSSEKLKRGMLSDRLLHLTRLGLDIDEVEGKGSMASTLLHDSIVSRNKMAFDTLLANGARVRCERKKAWEEESEDWDELGYALYLFKENEDHVFLDGILSAVKGTDLQRMAEKIMGERADANLKDLPLFAEALYSRGALITPYAQDRAARLFKEGDDRALKVLAGAGAPFDGFPDDVLRVVGEERARSEREGMASEVKAPSKAAGRRRI